MLSVEVISLKYDLFHLFKKKTSPSQQPIKRSKDQKYFQAISTVLLSLPVCHLSCTKTFYSLAFLLGLCERLNVVVEPSTGSRSNYSSSEKDHFKCYLATGPLFLFKSELF